VVLGLGWVILLGAGVAGQESLRFTARDVSAPDRVTECLVRDLNEDGRDDLFLVLGRAWWILYRADTGDGFAPETETPVDFAPDVLCFDVAGTAGGSERRLAVLPAGGGGTRLVPLGRDLPPDAPDRAVIGIEPVFHAHLLQDPQGDGELLALHRDPDGYRLAHLREEPGRPDGGRAVQLRFAREHHIHITGGAPFDRIVSETGEPALRFGDVDGDGDPDAILSFPTRLAFYLRDANGTLGSRAAHGFALPLRNVGTRLYNAVIPPLIVDLDGDHALDLVDVDANGGLVRIHAGPLTRPEAGTPHTRLRFGRPLLDAAALDVDRDGRRDLCVLTTERVNLLKGVRMFMTQTASARLLTFRQRPDGQFPARADAVRDVRLPVEVNTRETPPKAEPVRLLAFRYDLDGDRRPDLVVRDGRDALAIYRGTGAEGTFADRSSARLDLSAEVPVRYRLIRVGELNGDGKPDVVVIGWAARRNRAMIRLFLSR
jgi:hypothetical protein